MLTDNLRSRFRLVMLFMASLLVVEALNMMFGRGLNAFAIVPRNTDTLLHIVTAPFLHKDFMHFVANIFVIGVLAFVLVGFGVKRFLTVTVLSILITGTLVWLFARDGAHLGASGLLYAFFGYILLAGLKSKSLKMVGASLIILFLYGGLFWGVLPSEPFVSWESHLFGLLTGLTIAALSTSHSPAASKPITNKFKL